ncbi:MAG: two-component sensor histidine kinase [Lachnospiraceae bacterium]|nr:two-component sensor histidine kinase [Lachnospiraceae bacterium]
MKFFVGISFFVLVIALITFYSQIVQKSYEKKSMELRISYVQSQSNILATQLLASNFVLSGENTKDLEAEIDQLASVLEGRVIVIDYNYRVIKDTYTIQQGKYMISEDVFQIMRDGEYEPYEIKNNYIKVFTPIKSSSGGECRGVIIVTAPTKEIEATSEYVKEKSDNFYLITVILALLLACFIAIITTKDFKKMKQHLELVSEDTMEDNEIKIKGFSEMQDLAASLNQIIHRINHLEDSRQEFVSNVSHELKTPITSMKVLAESLLIQEDAPAEMYREFMGDIVAEIDRENQIINDLLSLIKMDKKATVLNISSVNINELLELLLKRLKPLAAKRNIEIVFESFRTVTAEIDDVKISLAISNLIENAIKYNVDNGWVRVSLNSDHKYFYIKVSDSGVGIPEDCQTQVFERFYRVDKARSRDTGGTGLGLSITRSAILMHKGAIKLYSKPGEGTTFTMRIPLTYTGQVVNKEN